MGWFNKTTSLSKEIEKREYEKEKLAQAPLIARARAQTEAQREIKRIREQPKSSGFGLGSSLSGFRDYATRITSQPKGKTTDMFGFGGGGLKSPYDTSAPITKKRIKHRKQKVKIVYRTRPKRRRYYYR